MKNDKVLITLGCSHTEGVGSYDLSDVSDKEMAIYKAQGWVPIPFYQENLDNFLKSICIVVTDYAVATLD